MARPIIWAIDDDPEVLRAVERDLRRHYGKEYRVMAAFPPAQAGQINIGAQLPLQAVKNLAKEIPVIGRVIDGLNIQETLQFDVIHTRESHVVNIRKLFCIHTGSGYRKYVCHSTGKSFAADGEGSKLV